MQQSNGGVRSYAQLLTKFQQQMPEESPVFHSFFASFMSHVSHAQSQVKSAGLVGSDMNVTYSDLKFPPEVEKTGKIDPVPVADIWYSLVQGLHSPMTVTHGLAEEERYFRDGEALLGLWNRIRTEYREGGNMLLAAELVLQNRWIYLHAVLARKDVRPFCDSLSDHRNDTEPDRLHQQLDTTQVISCNNIIKSIIHEIKVSELEAGKREWKECPSRTETCLTYVVRTLVGASNGTKLEFFVSPFGEENYLLRVQGLQSIQLNVINCLRQSFSRILMRLGLTSQVGFQLLDDVAAPSAIPQNEVSAIAADPICNEVLILDIEFRLYPPGTAPPPPPPSPPPPLPSMPSKVVSALAASLPEPEIVVEKILGKKRGRDEESAAAEEPPAKRFNL